MSRIPRYICHRCFDAIGHDGSNRIGRFFKIFSTVSVLAFENSRERNSRVRYRMFRMNADPKTDKILRSQTVDDRPQTVLSAMRTFRRIRIVPNGSARSSEITISFSTAHPAFSSRQLTASPLRFMYVCGFASSTSGLRSRPGRSEQRHSVAFDLRLASRSPADRRA